MIPVIDIFAGPGGLNEGFARYNDGKTFGIAASFEMEDDAVNTLKLRSAVRALSAGGDLYPAYARELNETGTPPWGDANVSRAMEEAGRHVIKHELAEASRTVSDEAISTALPKNTPWVLIGGPPCQAYSLVGRSRRVKDSAFYEDAKHTLYREYLHIVQRFRPAVFVMENVKGLLSSRTSGGDDGQRVFDLILSDVRRLGYTVHSLAKEGLDLEPSDFVIRAESYGIPQRRHRVILLGVRDELGLPTPETLQRSRAQVNVRQALEDLPSIRSLVSRRDDVEVWERARARGASLAYATVRRNGCRAATDRASGCDLSAVPPAESRAYALPRADSEFSAWVRDPSLSHVSLHVARKHMESDLMRYEFLAQMALEGKAPNVTELPEALKPNHANVSARVVPFVDRFKVQAWGSPSSTIASHISKDGHYYIHPDPSQMRSLTVREAARLQTFPDDYFFIGNRTSQYRQVGNAVPPLLARQIAGVVAKLFGEEEAGALPTRDPNGSPDG